MTKRLLTLLPLTLAIQASAIAQSFDVVQAAKTGAADYGGSGKWGQTFIPTQTGPLVGIRLLVTGRKWAGNHPYGSGFVVDLHRIENGIVQDPPIASGIAPRQSVFLEQPKQVDVYFDQPYTQTAGDTLAFTVRETGGGGANGWNDYAFSNTNPYPDGTNFSKYTATEPPEFKQQIDLTFSTITTRPSLKEQALEVAKKETGELVITLPYAETGRPYQLMESFDLQSWHQLTMKPGENGPLSWTHQPATPTSFYRVRSP